MKKSSRSDLIDEVNKEDMSDRAPSRIEDLANELWLDVFGHLDWINLFMAFHGINKRIDELLVRIKVLSLYSSYFTIHSNAIYIFFQVNLILYFDP